MIKLLYPKFWQEKVPLSYILWPFSQIYFLYFLIRICITKPIKLPGKVICVGNINVGGTGKTQIVIWLAKYLKEKNINYIIISKGYGSKLNKPILVTNQHIASEVGDEAIILRDYGRVIAAKNIKDSLDHLKTLKPDIIIVDDGMQNPNFYKDFTILTLDGNREMGNGFLIPAGPLRQYPSTAFKKIDVAIIVDNINSTSNFMEKIIKYKKPVFEARITPTTKDLDKTKKYFAFCGIGNPERFLSTLEVYGVKIVGHKFFPDHYNYSHYDLEELCSLADKNDSILITTVKDYVKIPGKFRDNNIRPFDVELSINNEKAFVNLINEKILEKN